MKVIAFSVPPHEKGILAHANQKKHEITLIANTLSLETTFYAQGKRALIDFSCAPISAEVLEQLSEVGITYVISHSETPCLSNRSNASRSKFVWANVTLSPSVPGNASLVEWHQAAIQIIRFLDQWQLSA